MFFVFLNYSSPLTEDFFRKKQEGINNSAYTKSKTEQVPGSKTGVGGIKKAKTQSKETGIVDSYDFERRYNHAKKEVDFFIDHQDLFDYDVRADKTYEICEKLENVILPKLKVMPSSPDKIPDPLSNADIVYMCEKRKSDPLEVYIDGVKADFQKVEDMLCGCGLHISLSNKIRRIRKRRFGQLIDMADSESDLNLVLDKAYPEEAIDKGYILHPNETILCSSNESLKLPHDIYAMVASKFSYAQLGLSIELSPNVIQSGHNGKIHFQIKNNTENYICIYPKIQVAQLLLFRTIQPSTKNYYDGSNHSYDRAEISPVSKFRVSNEALDAAQRPKAGYLKGLLLKVRDDTVTRFLGIIVPIVLCVFFGAKFNDLYVQYIQSLSANLPVTLYVVTFALVVCVANPLIEIFSAIILAVLQRGYYFIICKHWEKDEK